MFLRKFPEPKNNFQVLEGFFLSWLTSVFLTLQSAKHQLKIGFLYEAMALTKEHYYLAQFANKAPRWSSKWNILQTVK